MTNLTTDRLNTLAYELALGYHPPAELAVRFGVPVQLLQSIADEPAFSKLVHDARRKIDETGEHTRLLAKRLMSQLVPVMAQMARNEMLEPKDRIAAFKELKSVAGVSDEDKGNGGTFAIQINLGVN